MLAVGTGAVLAVLALALALVLVVLLFTMRGSQRRGTERRKEDRLDRGEAQRDADEAQERKWRAERDSEIARGE